MQGCEKRVRVGWIGVDVMEVESRAGTGREKKWVGGMEG